MGPCRICGKMIYLDWIAERGYHRECEAKLEKETRAKLDTKFAIMRCAERADREHEKRRLRKWKKRIEAKKGSK